LWAIARFDLRLSDNEFGSFTPHLFDLLLQRKQAADRLEYYRTGIIAAAVVNFSMGRPEKPMSPLDFVPGVKKKDFDLSTMSPEDQAKYIKGMFSKKIYNRKGR
jgi:hypothetical protein